MQKLIAILLFLSCFGICSGQDNLAWKQISDTLYHETPRASKKNNIILNKNYYLRIDKAEIKNTFLFWGTNEDLEQNSPLFHKKVQVCFLQNKKTDFFNLCSYYVR